ncbi:MAG: hypothetical protein QOF89_5088 [Acidobacteriota bacterium]|nr:hypothetical protein [Acidobacteriota bacterium]
MDKDLLDFLQAFREETSKRFDEMGQEVGSLREETSKRFDEMGQEVRQEVGSLREETSKRFDEMGQRFDARIDTFQEETTQRLDAVGADAQRAHILIEDLRDKVQTVAEGVAGANEQLQKHREEVSERFDTLESFYRRSFRALNSRVQKLEPI